MANFKSFSDTLKENLSEFEDYAPFIDFGPNLFDLLCDLLNQDIGKDLKLEVSAAIAYYVLPDDVIPEETYGPYGYVDDIFISVYILRKVADKFGYEFLQDVWEFDEDVKEVMDECYDKSLELLEDRVLDVLNYVGLVE